MLFNPEAILYLYMRDSMHARARQLFRMSCLLFEKSKLYTGNPPSHSLECNVVFIVCQDYYYKNEDKHLYANLKMRLNAETDFIEIESQYQYNKYFTATLPPTP